MLTPKDLMTRDVKYIHPNNSLKDAADTMMSFNIGAIPVVDNDEVIGMLTDRDIVVRAIAEGNDPESTNVKSSMSEKPITCYEDQDLTEISKLMKDNQVRRIVVLNQEGKMAGIFSLGDLATAMIDNKHSGEVLEAISN